MQLIFHIVYKSLLNNLTHSINEKNVNEKRKRSIVQYFLKKLSKGFEEYCFAILEKRCDNIYHTVLGTFMILINIT